MSLDPILAEATVRPSTPPTGRPGGTHDRQPTVLLNTLTK
jgi:hypothetical protein